MKPKIIVYLPVIHSGYLHLFEQYPEADILIANQNLIELIDQEFDYLRKEIRSITPQQAEISLKALLPKRDITLVGGNDLLLFANKNQKIILPNEDIFIWLSKKYLSNCDVTFDTTFLRWNRKNTTEKNTVSVEIKNLAGKQLEPLMQLVAQTAEHSSDWWRQVGAIAFTEDAKNLKNQKILAIAHNTHLPSPYTPYIDSDPRNSFHKGENIDLSTAIHAEAGVIAYCANEGISLKNSSLLVSTFPCPVCAKQVAASGIKKLYFLDGYSMLDGEKILKDAGVKIIKLK